MQLCSLVYSKAGCVQCTATLRALDAAGIAYRVVDLAVIRWRWSTSKSRASYRRRWSRVPAIRGRPDRIDELVKSRAA